MQPPVRKGRQIAQDARPQRALVYEKLSDPILVRRAKDGDSRALAALCERHAPKIERLAAHVLRDPEDARDAAQEALAKLCVRLPQFRGESRFSTWLYRLVVNTCRDVAERERLRACDPLLSDVRVAADDPAEGVARAELRLELGAELAELPPAQATVIVLKDAFGFSFEEISCAAGMPVGTAKCYAHRARARLRARLRHDAAA